MSSSDAVDNVHVGERHGSAWSLCGSIHGVGLPPLYVFHELAVVVVCRAGSEHEAAEAVAAQSLHGGVHAVDKVEILEGYVYALVGRASGVSLPARDDMEAHGNEEDRETYAKIVDEEIAAAIPELRALSDRIKAVKAKVYGSFAQVLDMKANVLRITKDTQRTHTFTHSNGKMRLTLGCNCIDGYRDTVEDGIAMVKDYIQSLATDEKTQTLVKAIMRLLSRDGMGNLKASRVLQLRKMADESKDDKFKEGVQIIEEAYQPTMTRQFIRAEWKDEKGQWHIIPLSVTDADTDEEKAEEEAKKD